MLEAELQRGSRARVVYTAGDERVLVALDDYVLIKLVKQGGAEVGLQDSMPGPPCFIPECRPMRAATSA